MDQTEIVKSQKAGLAVPKEEDLRAAFAEFLRLDVAEGDASPETIRTYWGQVNQYLAWCEKEGIHPALAIEEDIKAYRAHLVDEGYARSTIATRLSVIRRFYAMAQARGYRPDNPAEGVKAPKDHTDRAERVKWLPLAAVYQLLAAPNPTTVDGRRDRAILSLFVIHGLRVSEVAGLQLEAYDPEAGKAGSVKVLGKGSKRRTIYLVERSAAALRSWLEIRPHVAQKEEPTIFVSLHHPDPGTKMAPRSIRYLVDGYLEQLGLKADGISCHALRHSYATLSRAAGAKLDAIARTMGHSSVTTTQVYADIVDAMAENPARFLVGSLEGFASE